MGRALKSVPELHLKFWGLNGVYGVSRVGWDGKPYFLTSPTNF